MTHRYTCPAGNPSESIETPVVFVVDGDPSIRDALDVLIRSAGCQPRTAASAEEFLARPRVMAPSCLLVELQLPGLTGLGLQRLLFDRTELPIIFMSEQIDVPATVEAMKGGALEFLTKPLVRDVLLTAIWHAIERSRVSLHNLAQMQVLHERYASLTRREREVMSLVISGRLNKQVGCELGISEITVKAHRARMMRKMQARSVIELVTMIAGGHQRTPEENLRLSQKSNKLIDAELGVSEGTLARAPVLPTDTNVSTNGYHDAIAAGLRI